GPAARPAVAVGGFERRELLIPADQRHGSPRAIRKWRETAHGMFIPIFRGRGQMPGRNLKPGHIIRPIKGVQLRRRFS
ncbi:MAG TPA: hypothetical protein VGG25_20710, partial [Streptosporangiaceae bacterium]